MIVASTVLLLLAAASTVECQRTIPRSARASRNEAALEFECPEEFGYYPHPRDCTQYYVCVFGGALLESCTGGLMYSHELQTCDWPRNVGCPGGGSPNKETEEDPLLERSAKIESLQEQQQQQQQQQQHHHQHHRQQIRDQQQQRREPQQQQQQQQQRPVQRQPVTTTPPPLPQITEKQIRQRQQARNYHDEEYEPASEVESDRQQRVYRGQPSTIGQVQRDRDGLRRNVIAEREKESLVSTRAQTEAHYRTQVPSSESPRVAKILASTVSPVISKAYYNDPDQSYPYYTIYDDDVSIYKDDDYNQYTVNQSVPVQPSVKISEVNTKQYQKPKKVAVNEADKYNLNQDVTVQDYDIYENQAQLNKNKFRINEGQSFRPNVLSHPVVHVTTPNAIVDTFIPLTTTTQPPTTTGRPYTVNAPSRGRPQQVHRGTAPPRSRPTLKPSTEIVSKAQEFIDIYRYPPTRPSAIYPTPQVDKPAAKCRRDVCLIPDCSCGGSDIPGGIPAEQTPQIVLLTFDDAVNDLNKQLYFDLFENGRKNPNGCPITATFYVSHEWTDYSQVQNLYADGHEMASHTVSHSFGEQFSQRKWAREVAGQREILSAYGGVKLEDVRGMRAPFLSVGGNNMFKMLWDTNFTYDSSMPIYENRPPSWPYTLDYKLFHDCMIPPCPTRSYPGLWEVPMVMWQDLNGGRCSMGDACSNPPTADGVYKMLIKNFERHYTTNRAPFGLFYHAAWFTQPHHKEGFISFLDTIVAMDDVWIVTNWQAIQWVRNPTPLPLMHTFEPFGCNYPDRPKKCNNPKVCNLWHKSGVRYMKTCQTCPDIYPWTGKTGIRSSRIDNDVDAHE
ncbi:chitin deacetylase-like 5 isoform X2 [Colletes latitarsis]|uniref:chitin deacetylase-like 5 isoform X2 n=1 Tax=Colletes latitarsis TaxID=2605962 RepID=UPI004036B89C